MVKTTTKPQVKEAKTVKVSTVVVSIAVLIGLISSFVGGIAYANNYNSTVEEASTIKAVELTSKIQNKK